MAPCSPNEASSQVRLIAAADMWAALATYVTWSDAMVPVLRRGITVTTAEQHLQDLCMQSLDGLGLAGNKMLARQVLALLKTNKGRSL